VPLLSVPTLRSMPPRRRGLPPGLRRCGALLVCLLAAIAAPASGQSSRAELITQQEAAKAKKVAPHEPNKAEALVATVEDILLGNPSGFYPFFGSVWSGGGFTLGAGYRQFTGDNTFLDVKGLYSLSNYKYIETTAATLGLASGKVNVGAHLGWRDATQVAYYGVGFETPPEDLTNYRFKQGWVSGDIVARPVWWTVFGANVGYEDFSLESGTGTSPSIEEIFTPATAPGLGLSPKYLRSSFSAGIDTRPAAGYARRGTFIEARYHNYADQDDALSFDQVDAEITQHIPFLRESWVLSLHGLAQMASDDVPYFLMPSLGSGSTLRAFPSWRFRDRNSLLVQAEWRWTPIPSAIDMAFFFDAGKVTAERSQLDLNHLKTDFGIGFRFHSLLATPLRVELAKGNEGTRLVFAGSAAF
jgi:hypothetical protein